MTRDPLVSIVVLNLRGRRYTLECLKSMGELSYPSVSVVLIDNGCAEFSVEEIASLVPGGSYLRSAVNLGFTGGANLGIRHALAAGAEWVVLLNNDTRIATDAVSELVRVTASDPAIGIVGAKMLQMDSPERLETVGLRIDLTWGRLYQIGFGERDEGQYDDTSDVAVVSGGAMMLSRNLCERVGLFDDRYFRYLEDVDICMRARRAGFRVVLAPRARVYHKGKGMAGGHTSPLIQYYSARNHLLLMREHGGGGALLRRSRPVIVVALNLLYSLREAGPRLGRAAAVLRALRDYRGGKFGPAEEDRPAG